MSRVALYTRAGCHLCEAAEQVVVGVVGADYDRIDVDGDPALQQRYGDEVPVVAVDGQQISFWRIEESRLRAALDG